MANFWTLGRGLVLILVVVLLGIAICHVYIEHKPVPCPPSNASSIPGFTIPTAAQQQPPILSQPVPKPDTTPQIAGVHFPEINGAKLVVCEKEPQPSCDLLLALDADRAELRLHDLRIEQNSVRLCPTNKLKLLWLRNVVAKTVILDGCDTIERIIFDNVQISGALTAKGIVARGGILVENSEIGGDLVATAALIGSVAIHDSNVRGTLNLNSATIDRVVELRAGSPEEPPYPKACVSDSERAGRTP